jgi:hypothetical protein
MVFKFQVVIVFNMKITMKQFNCLLVAVLLLVSCAGVDFDELSNTVINREVAGEKGLNVHISQSEEWKLRAIYYQNTESQKMEARVFLDSLGERWHFYSEENCLKQQQLSEIAANLAESHIGNFTDSVSTFTYMGDTLRIIRCGILPLDSSQYRVIGVWQKKGRH